MFNFIKYFLISLVLHIIVFFVFNVKISGVSDIPCYQSKVAFIGPLLSSISFVQMMKPDVHEDRKSYGAVLQFFDESKVSPLEGKDKFIFDSNIKQKTDVLTNTEFFKNISKFTLTVPGEENIKSYHKVTNSVIKGNLENREIVLKPDDEEITELTLVYHSDISASFEITVIPSGKVNSVNVVETSGNTLVDIALKNYLKKWVFEPLLKDDASKGIVDFNFK